MGGCWRTSRGRAARAARGGVNLTQTFLIPTRTDEASLAGMSLVADRFTAARTTNPGLQLLGVVLRGVTRTATRVRTAVRASVQADLGGTAPVFDTVVR